MPLIDLLNRTVAPVGIIPAVVVQQHVIHESTRVKRVRHRLCFFKIRGLPILRRHSARAKNHADPDSGSIQDPDGSLKSFRSRFDVLMQINNPALFPPDIK